LQGSIGDDEEAFARELVGDGGEDELVEGIACAFDVIA
jgi:hypothetical protein